MYASHGLELPSLAVCGSPGPFVTVDDITSKALSHMAACPTTINSTTNTQLTKMAIHNPPDMSEMNVHDTPAKVDLQHSPTDMNGPFEAVTAQQNDDQASCLAMEVVGEQQHTLPIDDRLQALYNAFHTSFAFPISPHSAHMQHASDLAAALLQRHYPASQQYRVETCALGPLAKYDVNFMLKDEDDPDSDVDLPRLTRSTKQKNAPKKKKAGYVDLTWHIINPENMAAFVVKKGTAEVVEGVQTVNWRVHTHLVIVLDDLTTFLRWSRDNLNHRGDVLSDLSGVIGGMQKGHGMLFFGPRLELYSYDSKDAYHPIKPWANPRWRMDMRTTSLADVDEVLRNFVRQEPVYQDER